MKKFKKLENYNPIEKKIVIDICPSKYDYGLMFYGDFLIKEVEKLLKIYSEKFRVEMLFLGVDKSEEIKALQVLELIRC